MNQKALDFPSACSYSWRVSDAGPAGLLFTGVPAPCSDCKTPVDDKENSQFVPIGICRGTYVCFRDQSFTTVASQTCLTPETNCLLRCVNHDRFMEEGARLGDGWQCAGSERVNSSDSPINLHALWLAQPVPTLSRRAEQMGTSPKGAQPSKAKYGRSLSETWLT
jgi:hypothetical protein